jgi:DNA-binding MarR family transcriptional regulator
MPASRLLRAGAFANNGRDASAAEPAEETRPASRRAVTRGTPEPPSTQVLDALRAVARELRVSGRAAEQRVGLHPAQLHALQQLAERPAHSLAELAERTHTDPSSVSVVVQRLVERGLVVRTPAADDRRRTELAATASGRALARRAPESTTRRLERALSSMGDRDSATLARTLAALARGLRVAEGANGRR